MRSGNITMSILDGETESGGHTQVMEETVWVKKQGRGCPASSPLFPNYSSLPLIDELRFWKSILLATDKEAKQANNFFFF